MSNDKRPIPCSLCGTPPPRVGFFYELRGCAETVEMVGVICRNCGLQTAAMASEEAALRIWNRRVKAAVVEEVRA